MLKNVNSCPPKADSLGIKKFFIFLFLALSIIPGFVSAQISQQGPKLVGTGSVGSSVNQGRRVSISSDGNTAAVGGWADNNFTGAVWIFTRTAGVWTQQGPKLIGTGNIGIAYQGISVAISSDGNTVVEGGYFDNNGLGAVWVFTRNGGVWTQQGSKLIGSGGSFAAQGYSVAISSDGNTIIEGGETDNNPGGGAAWVFTRSAGVWTQQGPKLVGTGTTGASQGESVAISSDGNTCIIGGPSDNANTGAVWIFTRSGVVWTQQGSKIVGSGIIGNAYFGTSTALSSDGNTAITGGYQDNNGVGAVWVFTRSGAVWTQQGQKFFGVGAVGNGDQGGSVALSSDGNIAVEGGFTDNSGAGAIWIFTRTAGVWTQAGSKLVGTGAVGGSQQGTSLGLSSEGTLIEGGAQDNGGIGAAWVFIASGIGIQPISSEIPASFSLSQNYPNPFNPNSKIKFQIAKSGDAKLVVFDMLGREVATIVNENLNPGTYEVDFDGSKLSSGVYFYKLTAGSYSETRKMSLIK
jgi:hypothetical protein